MLQGTKAEYAYLNMNIINLIYINTYLEFNNKTIIVIIELKYNFTEFMFYQEL